MHIYYTVTTKTNIIRIYYRYMYINNNRSHLDLANKNLPCVVKDATYIMIVQ